MAILETEPQPPYDSSEQKEEDKFSVRDITSLVINSYRLSQGQPTIQEEFFAYLVKNYGDQVDPGIVKQAEPTTLEVATKIVANSKLHKATEDDVEDQLTEDLEMLYKAVEQKPEPNLVRLAKMMIEQDRKYLEPGFDPDNDGYEVVESRPRNEPPEHHTPATDPRLSQYVYYVLMGKNESFPVPVRRMLEDTRIVAENYHDDYFNEGVTNLVRLQIKHHPEQIDLLPEKYRNLV